MTRLYLLGAPHFEIDGQPASITTAKAVALMAYLAVTRTLQTRERLLGLLWAESSSEAARKNLRNVLWTIRKSLGEQVIQSSDDRLSLAESAWVDVHEFEKAADSPPTVENLQSSIALYRGAFLEGLAVAEAPEFEIWLTAERERLGQVYLRMLDALVNVHRAEGNWREVLVVAHRALAQDSLQEPMHRAMMEAHACLGERAEALRQYDTLQATLARELGVEPLPETKALRDAIISGAFDQLQSPAVTAVPRMPKRQPKAVSRLPFVGRQAERAALDAALQVAASGQARVVLLTGEVGIGKSRLWQEWSSSLDPGLTILESRCLDATQTLPFAPLIELFSHQACIRRLFTPPSPVPPVWLAEVARLLPEIRSTLPNLPAPAALPPEEEHHRLFEAFTQCLRAMGSRPVVFFMDDVHWADRTTLDWLGYLVHRLRDEPLLVVAAYRPEDAPAPLVHLAAGWAREGVMQRLPLTHLTSQESADLVASVGGNPALVGHLQAQSAGNPFFLTELARAASGDVPPVLTELVRARLVRLPQAAQQIVQAAAVIQPDFDFALLRRTSGRGEEETLDALDALIHAAVLTERNSHYTFTHPLVATVVLNGLSEARRVFLNRRAAEALEATYAGRLPQVAGQLAAHYAQAGDPVRAANFAEMAAKRALSLAATAEAVEFYRKALELDPQPARQLSLAQALYWSGDLDEARAALELALAAFEAKGDRRGIARAGLGLAETYLVIGRVDLVFQWSEKSLSHLDAQADPEAHARIHFLLGAGRLRVGRSLAEAETHLAEAAQLATENHLEEIAARSRFELGNLLAQRGDLASARQAYRDSIALAKAADNPFLEVLGHNNAAYHALLAGDLAAAREEAETGMTLADTYALRLPLQYLYSTRGEIALAERQWAEAEDWFNRGLAEAERQGNLEQAANYRANLGLAARGRGDLDTALMLLESAQQSAASLTTPHLQSKIDLWLTELYLERGERVAARQALVRAEARLTGGERRQLQEWAKRSRADLDR